MPSGPRVPGSHGDAKQPKKSKSKQTQQTKQTKNRLTKNEQDEAAVQKFLSSPAFNGFLDAKVTMEVEKQLDKKRRSDMVDKVYNRAQKVMRQFAFLADGDPEVYKDEGDLLVEYMGKMTELQCRRMFFLGEPALLLHHRRLLCSFSSPRIALAVFFASAGWNTFTFCSSACCA